MCTPTVEMIRCIDQCKDCHSVCLQTFSYCMSQGGHHAAVDHLRLLVDCAQICQVSADFMLRGSALHSHTCAACAEVCQKCAEDCERFADDQRMETCADTCRQCAELCQQMALVPM